MYTQKKFFTPSMKKVVPMCAYCSCYGMLVPKERAHMRVI